MAANAITPEQSLCEHISSVNEHAEELAAAGEWDAVSELLVKRDAMVREIESGEKADLLRASLRSTARIRDMVEKAKNDVGKELGRLQRGREAAESYGLHS